MDFQSIALPTELPSHHMAVLTGIEPAIFCVTGRRDKPLHYRTKWLRRKDSNQRPLGYEPNELTTAPLRDINGGGSRIRTRARSHACRFSRPIPSAGLGYSSVYIIVKLLNCKLVDPVGLEPTTARLWAGCSNQLSYGSKNGSGGGIRTLDLPGMNRTL